MIFDWLSRASKAMTDSAMPVPPYENQWRQSQDERRRQWLEMLGLWPLPERTPLQATCTGTLERDDYVVEKLHFQAVPGCYTTANFYRPAEVSEPLPGVIYHCGHGGLGKATAHYQAQGPFWARHGYVCIILDTIEIGEGLGDHHGTFRGGRWDWYSRGYTPSGMEAWVGMRALDYFGEREDVDETRVGITGISGGGAVSWWHGAADERVKIVAPVCQTGSVEMLVAGQGINGHCDCAVWNNYYGWCWPQIGALICPRPLLVCNGTDDGLWRPYAFRESVHRIKQLYSMLGIGGQCELLDEIIHHSYTPTSRQTIMRWFNRHLKGDDSSVTDDITDYFEPEENLLVFPGDRPDDQMPRVFEMLTPPAELPEVADESQWRSHQQAALARLRDVSFRSIPEESAARLVATRTRGGSETMRATEYQYDPGDGTRCFVRARGPICADGPLPALVGATLAARGIWSGAGVGVREDIIGGAVEVRGAGVSAMHEDTAWYVRRCCGVLGQTLPERQTFDLLGGIALLRELDHVSETAVYGQGDAAVHAIYAALLDESISEIVLQSPPATHEDPTTPEMPAVLRVGDLPHNLALAFPRPITFVGEVPEAYRWTVDLYEKLGRADCIRVIETTGEWRPAGE